MTPSSSASAPDPAAIVTRASSFLAEHSLWPVGRHLVVAVSGGADSTCLVHLLSQIRPSAAAHIVVAHVDHQLRPDSFEDARAVQQLARRIGLTHERVSIDVGGYALRHRVGVEHAARVLRYRVLAIIASRYGACGVAVGHTRDDSVESTLMHLIRGSGVEGLCGIGPRQVLALERLGPSDDDSAVTDVTIVRPLLCLDRAETVAYCRAQGIQWRDDPSNFDPRFVRNRIRHHLLPVLRTYNPSIDLALSRTSDLIRDEAAWAASATQQVWRRHAIVEMDRVVFPRRAWDRQLRAIQRRLFRLAMRELGVDLERFGFQTVDRALTFAESPGSGTLQLPSVVALIRDDVWIQFLRQETQ